MSSAPKPSLAASLLALLLACITASLVHWGDWTPGYAIAVVVASTLLVILGALALVLRLAPTRHDRDALWRLFVDTVRSDLHLFAILWRLIRGKHR
ncbi:MAG: hypothetical protein NTX56_18550 [Proteobacteria bacterium]|nr:hypothetical protein [Pseudomonadota bacterium]